MWRLTAFVVLFFPLTAQAQNWCADFDGDGSVKGSDLGIMSSQFNQSCASLGLPGCGSAPPVCADVDEDGTVKGSDLGIWAAQQNQSCASLGLPQCGAEAPSALEDICNPAAPVPSWATGRDAGGCLEVPGGGSWGTITFQNDSYNFTGVSDDGSSWRPTCPGSGAPACQTCNVIIWDSTFDRYGAGAQEGRDVWEWNTNVVAKHVLVKNVDLRNAWRCNGGTWNGPNGNSCSGAASGAHTDVWQVWTGPPEDGGWLVAQEMTIENSDTQHFQWSQTDDRRGPYSGGQGACADPEGAGGIVFQDVLLDQTASFEADCLARGGQTWACDGNQGNFLSSLGTGNVPALWFIEVDNPRQIPLRVDGDFTSRIIVVGGSGGGNGWPGPLYDSGTVGPGTCPNGLVAASGYEPNGRPAVPVYCYDSIDSALSAGETRPPFIQLSPAGWQ